MYRHKREQKMKKQQTVQKRAKTTSQTLQQQRCDQPLPLPASKSALETLPTELFNDITALLPYQSLISLSQVAETFRERLSFENGNYTFYQALPAVLLMQEEKDEKAATSGGTTATMAAAGTTQQVAAAASPASIAPGHGITTPSANFSTLANITPIHGPQSPVASFACLKLAGDLECSSSPRLKVLALGGPYEPSLDYRKQIILYSKQAGRCSECLVHKDSRGQVPQHRWSKLLCGDCFKDHAITLATLEEIALSKKLVNKIPRSAVHQMLDGPKVYYRPSVDAFLYSQSDCGLTKRIINDKTFKTAAYFAGLETNFEAACRQVRLQIVEAAESLWNGIDPYPTEIKNVFGEIISLETNPTLPPASHWSVFRDRFCPTSALKLVLFPTALLIDKPTLASAQEAPVFLHDPTSNLEEGDSKRLSGQWITSTALGMLYALTDFNAPGYGDVGMGRNCTVWSELAVDWHTKQLDADLASQAIIKMQKITPNMRIANDGMHRGIANLRERLGIRRIPKEQQHFNENNAAVRRSVFAKQDWYIPDFQYKLDATEDSVNKYFHRIARNACARCPISSFLFYPVGLAGLLEHMRSHHPHDFWTGHINFLV